MKKDVYRTAVISTILAVCLSIAGMIACLAFVNTNEAALSAGRQADSSIDYIQLTDHLSMEWTNEIQGTLQLVLGALLVACALASISLARRYTRFYHTCMTMQKFTHIINKNVRESSVMMLSAFQYTIYAVVLFVSSFILYNAYPTFCVWAIYEDIENLQKSFTMQRESSFYQILADIVYYAHPICIVIGAIMVLLAIVHLFKAYRAK